MANPVKEALKKTPLRKVFGLRWKVRNRLYKIQTLRSTFPRTYAKAAKAPVDERKVVFIENRMPELTNSFRVMWDHLEKSGKYDLRVHFLRTGFCSKKEYAENCAAMLRDMATAKYVFVNDASNVISCIRLRPETTVTQLWHGCGAFKKFGFSTAELIFGDSRKEMLKYPYYRNQTYITVSSPEVSWAYEEAMNTKGFGGQVVATGISRTDILYDENFRNQARKVLEERIPELHGRKVILYAPTFRGRVSAAKAPDRLDLELFRQKLGDRYILLIKNHPFVKEPTPIPESCEDFAWDVSDRMTIEDLMAVGDVCISDYSSLVFEYSIFRRPMLFFAYDLEEYFDWRGFYYDYDALTPGPVCTDNGAMIEYIEQVEKDFDPAEVDAFFEKYMSACDGHATKRICHLVFGEA